MPTRCPSLQARFLETGTAMRSAPDGPSEPGSPATGLQEGTVSGKVGLASDLIAQIAGLGRKLWAGPGEMGVAWAVGVAPEPTQFIGPSTPQPEPDL